VCSIINPEFAPLIILLLRSGTSFQIHAAPMQC